MGRPSRGARADPTMPRIRRTQWATDPLPVQPRPRVLVNLERAITYAEADRHRQRQIVERLSSSDRRRAEADLKVIESRLAQLYRSREVLRHGEDPEEEEAQAE